MMPIFFQRVLAIRVNLPIYIYIYRYIFLIDKIFLFFLKLILLSNLLIKNIKLIKLNINKYIYINSLNLKGRYI